MFLVFFLPLLPVLLLIGGAFYKISQVKYKWIDNPNKPGTKMQVEDLDYYYKPEELWEQPNYWKFEKTIK